jgi:hypothetical protein
MSKKLKTDKTEPKSDQDEDIGSGYDKIVEGLKGKQGSEKNRFLNGIKFSDRLNAMQILDKKIVDTQYEIKKSSDSA